jgi:glycosyltransferase involved in cell wall biosynthesis
MNIRVAYDITSLGSEVRNPDPRSGISRVAEEVMLELMQREEIDLTALGICGADRVLDPLDCAAYLHSNPELTPPKFVDSLRSRLGVRATYENIYRAYTSANFQKRPKLSAQSLIVRGGIKFFRQFDAYYAFNPHQFDLLHSPFHKLPDPHLTQGLPRILTVHDLIPIMTPEFVSPGSTEALKSILSSVNPQTDWVICNSEYTQKDFCEYTGMAVERTFVTPLAAAQHFYPMSDPAAVDRVRQRYGLPAGNYFLSIASYLHPRKNLKHLVDCFFRLLAEHPALEVNLVLAGSTRYRSGTALLDPAFAQFHSRVLFTGYVADADLSALYGGATAFIYPSLYEGFGLPPLEAMCCGTPVITSNTTSLPEVVGDAGILVDPQDADALTQAMLNLLQDRALVQTLRDRGLARSQTFSWAKCAADTAAAYKTVVDHAD